MSTPGRDPYLPELNPGQPENQSYDAEVVCSVLRQVDTFLATITHRPGLIVRQVDVLTAISLRAQGRKILGKLSSGLL